jgi:hypothetical protein
MKPECIDAENSGEALQSCAGNISDFLSGLRQNQKVRVFWSSGDDTGIAATQVVRRRDEPYTRKPWQFMERREEMGYLDMEGEECI